MKKNILLVFGRLPKKYWPDQHQEALRLARDHILCTKECVVEFTLKIVTCDHFSSLRFGKEDKVIVDMQEALKKSQGGILQGRTVDHLKLNYNREGLFSGRWTRKEREDIKLASLSIDQIPKSVFSYFTNWSENIAIDACCRCGFQISVSDITVQHLTVFFAHRGGKGNLGKLREKCSAEYCANISKAKMGKKHFAKHCANISKALTGKKPPPNTVPRSKSQKHSAEATSRTTEEDMSVMDSAHFGRAQTGRSQPLSRDHKSFS